MEHISQALKKLEKTNPTLVNSSQMKIDEYDIPTEKILGVSNLGHTFDNFVKAAGTGESLKIFKLFAEQTPPYMILCYGGVGNGKTYLLEATAVRLKERGIFARVVTALRLTKTLKRKMREKYSIPSYDDVLDNYCQSNILLMDDIGMGMMDSKWENTVLEQIVNYRYINRLWTAMTTNTDIKDLPDRVVSRFSDPEVGVIVHNTGKDYRRRIK